MKDGERNPYDHQKNIVRGHGRILWDCGDPWRRAAWALPGGGRTTSLDEAVAAARMIDAMHHAWDMRAPA